MGVIPMKQANWTPPEKQSLKANSPIAATVPPKDDVLLTEKQIAIRWGLASAKKLQADRVSGTGCVFIRLGRAVRYRLSDVMAYEAANLRTCTSEG